MAWQQIVTGTATELSDANPVLELNQLAVVTEVVDNVSVATRVAKLGDGVTRYNSLPNWPDASGVTNTPAGNVAGTTVQAAINELDTEKFGSASILRSYLAATVTYNANAVLANTPLSVTVAAGGIYAIELVVHSTSAVKALNMDFAGTATIANFIGEWIAVVANGDQTDPMLKARVTAAGTDFTGIIADVDGFNCLFTFTGSVEITDAGTFLLRGAQNASDASNTTILRGSTLTLTKMN